MYKHITKIINIAALTLIPTFALAEEGSSSGFFVGINTGYSASFIKTITTEQQSTQTSNTTKLQAI